MCVVRLRAVPGRKAVAFDPSCRSMRAHQSESEQEQMISNYSPRLVVLRCRSFYSQSQTSLSSHVPPHFVVVGVFKECVNHGAVNSRKFSTT